MLLLHQDDALSRRYKKMPAEAFFKEGRKLTALKKRSFPTDIFKYNETSQKLKIWKKVKTQMQKGIEHHKKKDVLQGALSSFKVGDFVTVRPARGGKHTYKGIILDTNRDGTYDVIYDTGEMKEKVPLKRISPNKSQAL